MAQTRVQRRRAAWAAANSLARAATGSRPSRKVTTAAGGSIYLSRAQSIYPSAIAREEAFEDACDDFREDTLEEAFEDVVEDTFQDAC